MSDTEAFRLTLAVLMLLGAIGSAAAVLFDSSAGGLLGAFSLMSVIYLISERISQ